MHPLKIAKIIFCFTVFLLIAKPFWGFSVFNRLNPPEESNILIKVFSKRKQEFSEGNESDITVIQKKLANPVTNLLLLFSHFLSILFPAFFKKKNEISASSLHQLLLRLLPLQHPNLLGGKLLI